MDRTSRDDDDRVPLRARQLTALVFLAGCAMFEPVAKPDRAQQAKLDRISVFPDKPNRSYEELGPVRVDSTVFRTCTADDVRKAALVKYPDVEALIDYAAEGAGEGVASPAPTHCEAMAVKFER